MQNTTVLGHKTSVSRESLSSSTRACKVDESDDLVGYGDRKIPWSGLLESIIFRCNLKFWLLVAHAKLPLGRGRFASFLGGNKTTYPHALAGGSAKLFFEIAISLGGVGAP